MANPQMLVEVVASGGQAAVTVVGHGDNVGDAFGDDEDFVIVLNSDAYSANAGIDDVLVGTPVTPGLAANSAILSNTTASGDILFAVADGSTNSQGLLMLDGSESNAHISNGSGMVVGHTAQITVGGLLDSGSAGTPELQVIGNGSGDTAISIVSFAATSNAERAGTLSFTRSGTSTVGTATTVDDGDRLGAIVWTGANGTDYNGVAASIRARVDGTVSGTAMPGDLVFSTTAAGAELVTDRLTIGADGTSTFVGDVVMTGTTPTLTIGDAGAEDTAIVFDGNALDYQIGLDDTADKLIIGTGSTLGTNDVLRIDGRTTGQTGSTRLAIKNLSSTFTNSATIEMMMIDIENADTIITGATTITRHQALGMRIQTQRMSSSSTVTVNDASHLYVIGPPSPDANVTFTNSHAIYITDLASHGGTVTNHYGIYVATQTGGTNDYGIYVQGANTYPLWIDAGVSRFDGGTLIGDTTSLNNLIDDASGGSGSTTLYIGDETITTSSDERLKTGIRPTQANAMDLVNRFNVVDFEWDDPTDTAEYDKNYRGSYTGMLAQETVKIAPWIINDQGGGRNCDECLAGQDCEEHGMWIVSYQNLVPTLVKAIQELNEKIQELEHGNR